MMWSQVTPSAESVLRLTGGPGLYSLILNKGLLFLRVGKNYATNVEFLMVARPS